MKTWDDWSDLDIDQAVTSLVFGCDGWEIGLGGRYFYHCGFDGESYAGQQVFNYCNSWADMGRCY